jgi:hypothetical protein
MVGVLHGGITNIELIPYDNLLGSDGKIGHIFIE